MFVSDLPGAMSGTGSERRRLIPNPAVELLEHFEAEDFEFFGQFDSVVDEAVRRTSRELPADFYDDLRSNILSTLISVIGGGRLRVSLVIDTNVLLADAFRVAQGKPSTTARLLDSRFVKLVAPKEIAIEARQRVVTKLPKGASLEVAQAHVEQLLLRIEIASEASLRALEIAKQRLMNRDIEDAPFLAALIDSGGEGIVSRDREAFESLEGVKRWELKELAELVTVYESGTLALLVGAATTDALLKLISAVFAVVANAIFEGFTILADIIVGLATQAANVLASVPLWAWAVLGVVGLGVLIAAIISEDFREWLFEGFASLADVLYRAAKWIVNAARTLIGAIHDALAWIWELIRPYVVGAGKAALVSAGVLYRRVMLLIDECNRAMGGTIET